MDTAQAVNHIRRVVKPARLVAHLSDGSHQEIQVSRRRGGWESLKRMLDGLPWVRLDCLALDGTQLDSLDGEAEPETKAEQPRFLRPENENLNLLIRGQEAMLDRVSAMIQPLVQGYTTLADVLARRLAQVERHHMDALGMLRMAAEYGARPTGEDTEDGNVLKSVLTIVGAKLGLAPEVVGALMEHGHESDKGDGAARAKQADTKPSGMEPA